MRKGKKVYKDSEKIRGFRGENRERSIKGCELSGVWPKIPKTRLDYGCVSATVGFDRPGCVRSKTKKRSSTGLRCEIEWM
jgi:hypothetical protein